jgi:hypothetical protein
VSIAKVIKTVWLILVVVFVLRVVILSPPGCFLIALERSANYPESQAWSTNRVLTR